MLGHHHETVVASLEGVGLIPTPSLEPLTKEQLSTLVDRLLVACETVQFADDPTGELVVRLTLTALQGISTGISQQDYNDALANVVLKTQMVESLTRDLEKVAQELTQVTLDFEAAEVNLEAAKIQSRSFKDKADRFQTLLMKIHNTLDMNTTFKESNLPAKVRGVIIQREEARHKIAALTRKIEEMESTPTEAQIRKFVAPHIEEQTQKAFVRGKQTILEQLQKLEWSTDHPTFKFRTGGKVPCCPHCQGLDPSRTTHSQSGHRKNCIVARMIKQANS